MLLTVKQVSELWSVSVGCVYQLIRSGDLPAYRIGTGRGTLRIRTEDAERLLGACRTTRESINGDDADGLLVACRTTKGPKRPPLKPRRAAEASMSAVGR